jgi:hypothetical protein
MLWWDLGVTRHSNSIIASATIDKVQLRYSSNTYVHIVGHNMESIETS